MTHSVYASGKEPGGSVSGAGNITLKELPGWGYIAHMYLVEGIGLFALTLKMPKVFAMGAILIAEGRKKGPEN